MMLTRCNFFLPGCGFKWSIFYLAIMAAFILFMVLPYKFASCLKGFFSACLGSKIYYMKGSLCPGITCHDVSYNT